MARTGGKTSTKVRISLNTGRLAFKTGIHDLNLNKRSVMKKLTLFFVALLGISAAGLAQAKKATKNVTIQTPGLHCENDKKRVEDYLVRVEGVSKVVADFKRKTVKVTFVTDRTNIENLKTDIANLGYDADDVTANPESQKKLPKSCQPETAPKKEGS